MKSAAILLLLLLTGCRGGTEVGPLERIEVAPENLQTEGDGELRAVDSTVLMVPGAQWTPRQLVWVVPDGSKVRTGQLLARFMSGEGQLDLEQASLDLQRNDIDRLRKVGELEISKKEISVDSAKVEGDLEIAKRYASVQSGMFSKNYLLDALQDEKYLRAKQGVLAWRNAQLAKRGEASMDVLNARRATLEATQTAKKQDLAALELNAPTDGVVVLADDEFGEKPRIGGQFWGGTEFASLPHTSNYEVQIFIPQVDAQGLAVGDDVLVYPLGRPDQRVRSRLNQIDGNPQTRNEQSPTKFVLVRALIPNGSASKYGWTPGQTFHAVVDLTGKRAGMTAPNLAISTQNGSTYVWTSLRGVISKRKVRLGIRGSVRSEVVAGLDVGEWILISPPTSETAP